MAERAKARLIEGPICSRCDGALTIREKARISEGSKVSYIHRDGVAFDDDHKGDPIYKVIRP